MIRSTVNGKWQTTIPAEVRQALRLQPGDSLIYEIRGQAMLIRPESLMDLAGSLKTDQPAGTKAQERESARQYVIAKYRASRSNNR